MRASVRVVAFVGKNEGVSVFLANKHGMSVIKQACQLASEHALNPAAADAMRELARAFGEALTAQHGSSEVLSS